jgi:hypothetical protein
MELFKIIYVYVYIHAHSSFTNRCTFIRALITIYIKLYGSYMFRSTTIIRELAIEPE